MSMLNKKIRKSIEMIAGSQSFMEELWSFELDGIERLSSSMKERSCIWESSIFTSSSFAELSKASPLFAASPGSWEGLLTSLDLQLSWWVVRELDKLEYKDTRKCQTNIHGVPKLVEKKWKQKTTRSSCADFWLVSLKFRRLFYFTCILQISPFSIAQDINDLTGQANRETEQKKKNLLPPLAS